MNALANSEQPRVSWLSVVDRQASSLQFGVVQIVVHNSQVVQIERTEKVDLDRPGNRSLPTAEPTP